MGLFGFIGDAFNDIFGGNSSRADQQRYNVENMELQQFYNKKNMELQQHYNEQNMRTQQAYALQNMQQQFNYDVRAFNMENEYNTPSAQRQRMQAAGLNPNWSDQAAIAQMDSAVSPVSPSSTNPSGGMPSSGMPSGQNINPIDSILNLVGFKNQQDLVRAQKNMIDKQAEDYESQKNARDQKTPFEIENLKADSSLKMFQSVLTDKEATYYYENLQRQWKNLDFENKSLDWQVKHIQQLLPYECKFYDAQTKEKLSQSALNYVLAKYKPIEVGIEKEKVKVAKAQVSVEQFKATTDRYRAQIDAKRQKVEAYLARITGENISAQTTGQTIQNGISGILFDAKNYARSLGIPRKEQEVLFEKLEKERDKIYAEINDIIADEDLKKTEKRAKISEIYRSWTESMSDIFSPFMPGAGFKTFGSGLLKLFPGK